MIRNVFTIPPHAAFLDALVDGLWQRAGQDVFKLSQGLILLPTRRASRALRQAFLERTGQTSMLLPRMQPLGDIDEEELYFSGAAEDGGFDANLPPAISPLRRQLLLTQLVSRKDPAMPLDQAAQLAEALARFLDQAQTEGCDLGNLAALVQDRELAVHWQETVAFLDILTDAWPALLESEGCIDPADRRNRLLRAQAAQWREQPPAYPVIAAGSTGSVPAAAELLAAIAALPNGAVILPGLDQQLDETAWQMVADSHPQFGMKHWLEKIDLRRDQVALWPSPLTSEATAAESARRDLLRLAMRPADVSDEGRSPALFGGEAVQGLSRIELDHGQEEAQTIALIMRHVLETPGKTANLVTPDRGLAERVAAALERWGIKVNDSAGSPLAAQPVGAFLRDLLAAARPDSGAVVLLSLLKHPFTACGLPPALCRAKARQLEITVWRSEPPAASDWLTDLKTDLAALTSGWMHQRPLTDWIDLHIRTAETFARSDRQSGAERLWRDDAGEAAAAWFDEWRRAAAGFPMLSGDDYAALFDSLLRTVVTRPAYGQHPRLNILGLLEARMMTADVTILGGLNEGVWPPEPPVDPWMSRPMRASFGLPSPERRIGLAAHDFVQLASGPDVILTRTRRMGNAPAVPSRFVLQLETTLRAAGLSEDRRDALAPALPWQAWARQLDMPEKPENLRPPEPRPPLAARPKKLSVTEIGLWRRNPYAIYARHILKLKKLDALDAAIDAADRGIMIHAALDRFAKTCPDLPPPLALEKLLEIGRAVFAPIMDQPEAAAFWWPRFVKIATWFVAHDAARRGEGIRLAQAEASGRIKLGEFTLHGRADRIDRLANGGLAIIDYKTGAAPAKKSVLSGDEPQLPLLALIAQQGGFDAIPAAMVEELAYWKLGGARDIAGEDKIDFAGVDLVAQVRADLEQLIAAFGDPAMPYRAAPIPALAPRYDDYAHLARLSEWGRTEAEA